MGCGFWKTIGNKPAIFPYILLLSNILSNIFLVLSQNMSTICFLLSVLNDTKWCDLSNWLCGRIYPIWYNKKLTTWHLWLSIYLWTQRQKFFLSLVVLCYCCQKINCSKFYQQTFSTIKSSYDIYAYLFLPCMYRVLSFFSST